MTITVGIGALTITDVVNVARHDAPIVLDPAALTEVGLTAGAAPDQSKPIDFVVDHPYVLRLRDLATGTTLVQAAIMDPTA